MRCRVVIAAFVVAALAAGCGDSGGGSGATLPAGGKSTILLTSPAFRNGAPIPKQFTCDGAGISPPLHWSGAPSDARELALIVNDTDAGFVHWTVLKIPPSVHTLAPGHGPPGAIQTKNDFGDHAYGGPAHRRDQTRTTTSSRSTRWMRRWGSRRTRRRTTSRQPSATTRWRGVP